MKAYVARTFIIPSESMVPTLAVDDRVLVNKLVPNLVPLHRGDVVVFADQGGWAGSEPAAAAVATGPADSFLVALGLRPDLQTYLVKRVIGLPGDTVACCDDFGDLTVNGVPIDEPYLAGAGQGARASLEDFEVTVPDHALWVLGDNRDFSRDSRAHVGEAGRGFVPIDAVEGRAVLTLWPFDRWSWLDRYADSFGGIDGPAGR